MNDQEVLRDLIGRHESGRNIPYAMNWASEYGYLEVVKYLHSVGKECTTDAINWASMNGHLSMVKYLHSIGKECTTSAMDLASENGHLEVVRFLRSPRGFMVLDKYKKRIRRRYSRKIEAVKKIEGVVLEWLIGVKKDGTPGPMVILGWKNLQEEMRLQG